MGAVMLSWTNWKRYQETPIVISMERNFREWNTTFPSVTICPNLKYDNQRIVESALELNGVYIHSPSEIPDSSSKKNFLDLKHYLKLTANVKFAVHSTDEIRSLSVSQRKCRFQEESNLDVSPFLLVQLEAYFLAAVF
ncbi:hypothetical protein C0J52_19202 [Blattella germanica]|nr:hypothetical protein C0J52_19202 [Blattella germanica]